MSSEINEAIKFVEVFNYAQNAPKAISPVEINSQLSKLRHSAPFHIEGFKN